MLHECALRAVTPHSAGATRCPVRLAHNRVIAPNLRMPLFAVAAQRHEVIQDVFEFAIAVFLVRESRHRARSMPRLEPHQKLRQGLVIEDRSHAPFAMPVATSTAANRLLCRIRSSDIMLPSSRDLPDDTGAELRLRPFGIEQHHAEVDYTQCIAGRTKTHRDRPLQAGRADFACRAVLAPLVDSEVFEWPFAMLTRTTRNLTGCSDFPVSGDWSPNSAMKACPTWPKWAEREKSSPFDDAWTPRMAAGRGGVPG